jgi:hypothetical protein
MATAASFSLIGLRRTCAPMVWIFVLLVLAVFVERRVAESDFDDDAGVVLQNDEAVEGEEILNKLLIANDVVIPIAPKATALEGERPVLLGVTALSLLAVRGLESRAPPALSLPA